MTCFHLSFTVSITFSTSLCITIELSDFDEVSLYGACKSRSPCRHLSTSLVHEQTFTADVHAWRKWKNEVSEVQGSLYSSTLDRCEVGRNESGVAMCQSIP